VVLYIAAVLHYLGHGMREVLKASVSEYASEKRRFGRNLALSGSEA
jgi:hypothetical protein